MPKAARKQAAQYPGNFLGCLRSAALFSGLTDAALICFSGVAQMRAYKKGKVIYVKSEPASFFYIICGGWIKLLAIIYLTNPRARGSISS